MRPEAVPIIRDGIFPVAILGDVATSTFELVDIENPRPTDLSNYLGCVGIVNGKPATVLETPLDSEAINMLAAAYLAYVNAKLHPETKQ